MDVIYGILLASMGDLSRGARTFRLRKRKKTNKQWNENEENREGNTKHGDLLSLRTERVWQPKYVGRVRGHPADLDELQVWETGSRYCASRRRRAFLFVPAQARASLLSVGISALACFLTCFILLPQCNAQCHD